MRGHLDSSAMLFARSALYTKTRVSDLLAFEPTGCCEAYDGDGADCAQSQRSTKIRSKLSVARRSNAENSQLREVPSSGFSFPAGPPHGTFMGCLYELAGSASHSTC